MEELLKKITADVISQTGEDVDYYRNVIPDNRAHLAEELCKNNFERSVLTFPNEMASCLKISPHFVGFFQTFFHLCPHTQDFSLECVLKN